MSNSLENYGWSPDFADAFTPFAVQGLEPARVVLEHRRQYRLQTDRDVRDAELLGRLLHLADAGELHS